MGEQLREAALLVLQSQRVSMRKRPLALSTALAALQTAIEDEARSPAREGLRLALEQAEKWAQAADHDSIEDGPAFARGVRAAAKLFAALSTPDPAPAAALDVDDDGEAGRIVASHWLAEIMASETLRSTGMSHPVAMILAALNGERDPDELGIGAGSAAATALARLSTTPSQDPSHRRNRGTP